MVFSILFRIALRCLFTTRHPSVLAYNCCFVELSWYAFSLHCSPFFPFPCRVESSRACCHLLSFCYQGPLSSGHNSAPIVAKLVRPLSYQQAYFLQPYFCTHLCWQMWPNYCQGLFNPTTTWCDPVPDWLQPYGPLYRLLWLCCTNSSSLLVEFAGEV